MHIFFYDLNVIYRAEFIIISFLDFSPSAAAGGGLFQLCFIVATSADVHVHVDIDVVSSGATALGMTMCHLHTQPQAVAIMTLLLNLPGLTGNPFQASSFPFPSDCPFGLYLRRDQSSGLCGI